MGIPYPNPIPSLSVCGMDTVTSHTTVYTETVSEPGEMTPLKAINSTSVNCIVNILLVSYIYNSIVLVRGGVQKAVMWTGVKR